MLRKRCLQKIKKKTLPGQMGKKNPLAFTGRYPYLKEWLGKNPDYLKNHRKLKQCPPPDPTTVLRLLPPPALNLNRVLSRAFAHIENLFPERILRDNYITVTCIKASVRQILLSTYIDTPLYRPRK
jgi:hypothetical protein